MTSIIQLDRSDLRSVFDEMFRENLKNLQSLPKETPPNDTLYTKEAHQFLIENGRPLTLPTFYKATSNGEIPLRKIGKRNVFSRKELLNWINSGCPNIAKQQAAQKLAETVKSKINA